MTQLSADARWPVARAPSRYQEIRRGGDIAELEEHSLIRWRTRSEWRQRLFGLRSLPEMLEDALDHRGILDEESGMLTVGGVRIDRLAHRVGSTPFFAYDRRLLTERVAQLRRVLPDEMNLSYAIKANPMPAVVQHLSGLVDGLDVASAGEMRVALDTPKSATHISFAGPGKTEAELTQAIAAGVTIEMESRIEAERAAAAGERLGIRPRVAIRVNPDFAVKGSGMRMGGGPQQFGVDSERVPTLVRDLRSRDLDFLGLHIFAGSQNLSAQILIESQRKTVALAVRIADETDEALQYLNIDG